MKHFYFYLMAGCQRVTLLFALLLGVARLPARASTLPDLATVLNADGTIRRGGVGSFRAAGFCVGKAADGRPSFRPLQTTGAGDEHWQDGFGRPGLQGSVFALAHTSSGDLIAGGNFRFAGSNARAARIARYHGSEWQALGDGLSNDVLAVAVLPNGDIVAGGKFQNAGNNPAADYVARWDGATWQPLGTGLGADVYALAVAPNGDIYAGGSFNNVGSNSGLAGVARWDGTAWRPLGAAVDGGVETLAFTPAGDLIAGGAPGYPGAGHTASGIARWDGAAWQPLGAGLPSLTVSALALTAAGDILAGAGNYTGGGVWRWDGAGWTQMGGSINGTVNGFGIRANGDIVACGQFSSVTGVGQFNVNLARWDGAAWQNLPNTTTQGAIYAASVAPNGDLAVGGDFPVINSSSNLNGIARWTGTAWLAYGLGLNNKVETVLVMPNGDIVVGGRFTDADNNPNADYVARWDGTGWQALGTGLNSWVTALALAPNGDIIAGGYQNTIGYSGYLARWNGSTWQPLNGGAAVGLGSQVNALAVTSNGDVIVGGQFLNVAGNANADNIVRWNGTTWQPLGGGLNNTVTTLVVTATGDIIAGGAFTNAGGNAAARGVARWNGTAWQPLGAGVAGTVTALALAANGDVVAGGTNGTVARWNGTTWQALAPLTCYGVSALAVAANGDVVAAGSFANIGSNPYSQEIIRWNGTAWQTMGTGLDRGVSALAAVPNGDVVVGGVMSSTADGSKISYQFARYRELVPRALTAVAPAAAAVGATVVVQGTNLVGATALTFNGINAPRFTVNAIGTAIEVIVPANATAGMIQVVLPGGTYTAPTPFCPQYVPVVAPASSCGPGALALAATGAPVGPASAYAWYTQPSGGTAIPGAITGTYTTPALTASTTYYVAVSTGSGATACEGPRTAVPVAIGAAPVVVASGPTALCAGGSVTLTASGAATYLWSTGATTASISATTAGTYTVTGTNPAGGCTSASAPVAVSVSSVPARPTVTQTPAGSGILLSSSATTGNQWYRNGVVLPGANGTTYLVATRSQNGAYTVIVTSAAGCASLPSTGQAVLGTLPAALASLALFPNPAHGRATVQLPPGAGPATLTLLDALGRALRTQTASANAKAELDLSGLAPGLYAVRVAAGGATATRRLVVN